MNVKRWLLPFVAAGALLGVPVAVAQDRQQDQTRDKDKQPDQLKDRIRDRLRIDTKLTDAELQTLDPELTEYASRGGKSCACATWCGRRRERGVRASAWGTRCAR